MKKLTVLLVLVASLLLLISVASAAPITYNSGFQVQNLSGNPAEIIVNFYAQDGTLSHSLTDTIAANDSKTFFPLPTAVGAGFNGSVVISSTESIASIANILGDGLEFGASYGSFDGGAQSVNLPLIMKGNAGEFDTWFNVQNAGSTDVDVSVNYAGTACVETYPGLKPGAAHTFDQASNTCLPSPYVGAASVTSKINGSPGGSIVATVMETGNETLYAYNGFTSGSTAPVMPLTQFNNGKYSTGIQIQNTGGTNTNVTVSYTPVAGAGTACTETQTIKAGNSATFGLFAFTYAPPLGTTDCAFGTKFVGSARVSTNSAGHELVSIINQTNFANYGSSYNGFDPASATSSVTMPLIMDRNAGWYTGFNVMNVGASNTTVICNFTNTSYSVSQAVPPGGALNDLQLNKIADRYVGSAVCNASAGGSIVAVVNELGNSSTADLLLTYEGFNQ
jgi:hypothetical protein